MNVNVIGAIFRRNFYSYFSNPTGYVFICVYVMLSSFAAFWPNEFFSSNLANLDQLNRYLPYIMLVFIPAITMSIWAEERRQGTDELLLTIPAADFDVVIGKYLAAVAIYSVALSFSMICNLCVLAWLSFPVGPDLGLFFGTYFGYWLVGTAMLSVGMVASFLTGNLTVGFVLGSLFNAPLAFAAKADVLLPSEWAIPVKQWSLEEQFRDFGRGVISLSGLAYFALIVVVMLYLCMVLIGRRHWQGGRDGHSLGGHYLARSFSLVVLAIGLVMVLQWCDLRADVTYERLSSLAPQTRQLLRDLKRPVRVEAYVSPDVPETFVQTRLDLLSMLREMEKVGGSKIRLNIHDTRPLSNEADQAEQQYGITAQQVLTRSRGALSREQVYLGVAFTSGLEKVVVPAFGPSVPVEYELVRSIATVADTTRKKLGVLNTDVKLFGGFDFQSGSQSGTDPLVEELQKQYEVVQVNADEPIKDDIDVLLAVQPSTLSPPQMKNLVAAVRAGIPTAIFEDPLPLSRSVPGTGEPKRPQNPMMGMNTPPTPKGDIGELWDLLGIEFTANELVCQPNFNPEPKLQAGFQPEWLFISPSASPEPVFSEKDPITKGLAQVLLMFAGSVSHRNVSELNFEPLMRTGEDTGAQAVSDVMTMSFFGPKQFNTNRRYKPRTEIYTVAAHITGRLEDDEEEEKGSKKRAAKADPDKKTAANDESKSGDPKKGDAADEEKEKPVRSGINVVVVPDIDMLHGQFFEFRPQQSDPDRELNLNLDNVTFVLNTLDSLAGDDRFIEIRKRRPQHRTLLTIERQTTGARDEASAEIRTFYERFDEARKKEQKELDDAVAKLEKESKKTLDLMQRIAILKESAQQRLAATTARLEKERDRDVSRIERKLNGEITSLQDWYKMMTVVLPPVLPMLVGLVVFFNRRAHEREGVSRNRLR